MSYIFDNDLLPCPFCGGKAEWEYTEWDEENDTGDDGTGFIRCRECYVQVSWFTDRDGSVERWNKKVAK